MDPTEILNIVNLSDRGRRRPHNEDSSASDARTGLLVIADGMGGYKAGEVASTLAVISIMNRVRRELRQIKSEPPKTNGYSTQSSLVRRAIIEANALIFETAQAEAECRGMGTTVLAVLFYDNRITIAHVGDSRLYRLRSEYFEQLTHDHSLTQVLIDRDLFTPEEAQGNVSKNLITRALGVDETVEIEIEEMTVQPGDIYLLCTDGLSDMVSDADIHSTLHKYSANLMKAGDEMIKMANERGGKDNISVILAQPRRHFPSKTKWYSRLFG